MTDAGLPTTESSSDGFLAAVRQFAVTAHTFCHIIDERDTGDALDLCDKLNELLPTLYLDARRMVTLAPEDFLEEPEPEVVDEDLFEPIAMEQRAEAEAEADDPLVDQLLELFGDQDAYFIGSNFGSAAEPDDSNATAESMAARLAETYEQFSEQFGFLENGGANGVEDAARGWIYGFYAVWGEQILRLLEKTHAVIFETLDDDDIEEESEP